MIGFFLAFLGSFFREVSSSIGKWEILRKEESMYTMAFLNLLVGAAVYFGIAFFVRKEFLFSFESLPTFAARAILEIFQAHVSIVALVRADRSTYSFIRTATIPLLFAVDILLGYAVGFGQAVGVLIIFAAIFLFLMSRGVRHAGAVLTGITAVNAVATLSLYKYNITHYNSVEAEQGIITLILIAYFGWFVFARARENPFQLLKKPFIAFQSLSNGGASILEGFSYAFAPASLILAAERSSSIFWAIVSGNMYFHERAVVKKILFAFVLAVGFWLMAS